jgi:queuosine precursor transporter
MDQIKKINLLFVLYIFCVIVSELMGAKTFSLLNYGPIKLNASVAIFLFPILFTINDIITEVLGKEKTKELIRLSLLVIVLLVVFSFLAVSLPPSSRFSASEPAYDLIFGTSIRISVASLMAFALAEFMDVFVFVKIRQKMGKSGLWLRNNASNFVAQFFDTAIFMSLAFYTLNISWQDNLAFLLSLILPYWFLKCSASIVETPLVYLGVNWLKKDTAIIKKRTA